MNRVFFLAVFIVFICAAGCRKDYPAASNDAPVFYFKGSVSNIPFNLQAGVNNYYMYSSYLQDADHVYNFLGELKPTNCVHCNSRIKFQINNDTVSSALRNTSLTAGYYSFLGVDTILGTPTQFPVNFISSPSSIDSVLSYSWNFGDGATSALDAPIHTYSHPGYYNTCLTINYANNCSSSICNQVKVGVPDAACSVSLISSVISGNNISFSSSQISTTPYTYIIDFGDGIILNGSSSNSFISTHTYVNSGIYKVSLQITGSDGCTSKVFKNVATQGFAGCFTNFDFAVQFPNANLLSLSNVVITWTDNSGVVYYSNTDTQPNDSYFQIISTENYSNNENNQPVKKLHVKFKCSLFQNNGPSLQMANGDAVIAVSYQ